MKSMLKGVSGKGSQADAVPEFAGTVARGGAVAAFVAATLHASALWAQSAPQSDALDEIVVTGTRQSGLSAAESPTPIQIVSPESLAAAAGNTDLMKALAQVIPSLTSQPYGNGGSNHTLMVKLKGLSPNHVLILVNGKRRHTTANLAVNASAYQGGAGADLNFIPMSAIDHVEVLTEGAAAQYGSDAIAGVINIILKKSASGGSVSATYGQNFDDGPANNLPFTSNGGTATFTANAGLTPIENGYLNVSAEVKNHNHTFVGAEDPRTTAASAQATSPGANMASAQGYPYLNWIQGDAAYHSKVVEYNAGYDFGGGTELYSFGTYGVKDADSYQNYRGPTVYKYTNTTTGVTTYPYPFGFEPREAVEEVDFAGTIGLKTSLLGWSWDLSSTWGRDRHDIYTLDSANTTYYATTGNLSQTDFYDGSLIATQWTTDLDVNRDFDVGLASPLNVALGLEHRRDTYEILAGDEQSWKYGGAAANAGYSTQDAGNHGRNNDALYIDLGGKMTQKLRLDAAGRFEHYSDFGSKVVGKLSARYDFVPAFAMRATVSTGFRAPTLAEEYYSAISVGPSSISAQLPPNGAAAAVLGLGDLKPERSVNQSVGFVFRPTERMNATLDLYRIRVADRIIGSGTLYGTSSGVVISSLINDVLNASGIETNGSGVTSTGINLFTNGVNTKTDGADLTFDFPVQYSFGDIDWNVGANYNTTSVTYVKSLSDDLVAALRGSPVYSQTALANLTTATPKYVVNLGARWSVGRMTLNVLEKIYGKSSSWGSTTDNATGTRVYYENVISAAPITNVDLSWKFSDALNVTVGANNLFNRYPNKLNSELLAALNSSYAVTRNDASGAAQYPIFSPYGINGGFYYVRATYGF
ncbi:MAG: TonB-dependent receptor [Steroidobacteraceae bacterium]